MNKLIFLILIIFIAGMDCSDRKKDEETGKKKATGSAAIFEPSFDFKGEEQDAIDLATIPHIGPAVTKEQGKYLGARIINGNLQGTVLVRTRWFVPIVAYPEDPTFQQLRDLNKDVYAVWVYFEVDSNGRLLKIEKRDRPPLGSCSEGWVKNDFNVCTPL